MRYARNILKFAACVILVFPPLILADEPEDVQRCLNAWGDHPFGHNPSFRTMSTSVKIFGIGQDLGDHEQTNSPRLVLVNPSVNIMGGAVMELLNPNGWYCLRSNVNVMGGVTIRAHCAAHIASATDNVTVMGTNSADKGITVMGSTKIELTGCR